MAPIAVIAVLVAGAVQAAGVPNQGTWETTLLGRDIGGNPVAASSAGAVFLYDTTLDITWLRDATYARTSGYTQFGLLDWTPANTWVSNLKVGDYSGWRLPTMIDTDSAGCNFNYGGGTDCAYNVLTKSGNPKKYEAGQTVYSEMAHLFYVTLGNKADCPPGDFYCSTWQPGRGLTNTGSFQNMQGAGYWAGLEYPPAVGQGRAWYFDYHDGEQYYFTQYTGMYTLAVHPGDVAAVPEPNTCVLLMLGLTGLALARRRPY